MTKEITIKSEKTTIYAYQTGALVNPMVFLHGFIGSHQSWDEVVSSDEAHYMKLSSSIGLVPLLGLELNLKIISFSESLDLYLNNFVSYVVNNHALSLKKSF